MPIVLPCHKGIGPAVTGTALVARDNFSARYDLDRLEGTFSRPAHKLYGQSYVGKVLVLVTAKGGVASAWMLHEMAARGMAPKAILLDRANTILAQAGLPVPVWTVAQGKVSDDFPLPAIVKPAAEDASAGLDKTSVCTDRKALRAKVAAMTEQFDEVSHASGLPTRARDLGSGYDDALLFWALRNSHLLRERISIVDIADLLGVWSDDTARSIVTDSEKG